MEKSMYKEFFACTVTLALTVISFRSVAQPQLQPNTTGNAFLALCAQQGAPAYQNCVWYVIGCSDGLNVANMALDRFGRKSMYCLPTGGSSLFSNVTGVQMVDMVLDFLRRNPQRRDQLVAKLIIDTFKEAWPCP
jgi:hypothetical protein